MKKRLAFFAYNLDFGGIEKSLVNLLNRIDMNEYEVSLFLEKKEGVFLHKVNPSVKIIEYEISNNKNILFRKIYNFFKRFIWSLFNRNKYDFSCCYATYSFMGSKLSKIASRNSSIYIHSDYRYLYKEIKEFEKFFSSRGIDKFNRIFFVSNESRNNFLDIFNNLENKSLVLNNFIDDKEILSLSLEKVNYKKKNGIQFVFIGRLDESSKQITKLLHLIIELNKVMKVNLLVVGDGPDKEKYLDYVKKHNLSKLVDFVGSKTNPYPYINLADYLVLTSLYEGNSLINDNDKLLLASHNIEIGKRATSDTDKSGNLEKASLVERQFISLLPAYDFLNASLDSNCTTTTAVSCTNYNYLAKYKLSWWLATANAKNTHHIYKIDNSIGLANASSNAYVRPVIYLTKDAIYVSGDGSNENPYVVR